MFPPILTLALTPLLTLLVFGYARPRAAAVGAYVVAWLFLPVASLSMLGLPDLTKVTATNFGALIALALFGRERLASLRPCWPDLPAGLWCLVAPMASSLSNGLGAYDGLSGILDTTMTWGVPYLVGRCYLGDPEGRADLVRGIILGGLAYVPLCLLEVRFSPQMHRWTYGFIQHSFAQVKRYGGFRPMVFMSHGLEVGMWMASATLACFWTRRGRSDRFRFGILAITTVLCKSGGALALMLGGLGLRMLAGRSCRAGRLAMLALALTPAAYVTLRTSDLLNSQRVIGLLPSFVPAERADSLLFRLDNEDILKVKALQRPLLGWGGWGRSRVYDAKGRDITITDSLWIIILGKNGIFGLAALTAMMALPPVRMLLCLPAASRPEEAISPAMALAAIVGLFAVDCLFNAMINPVYILAIGALASYRTEVRLDEALGWEAAGRVHAELGQEPRAVAAWSQAVAALRKQEGPEVEVAMASIQNDLAWLLCRDPASAAYDPATAVTLASEAAAAAPGHPAVWNTLGLALHRVGDHDAAVEAIHRSIAYTGGAAHDYLVLAMACRDLGHTSAWRRWLDRATQVLGDGPPEHPDLKRLLQESGQDRTPA